MRIEALPAERIAEAVALWQTVGLTRPWNDPHADATLAISGDASTILAGIEDDRLLATAMTGHDGHRGWVYYLAVHADARRRGLGTAMMRACEDWLNQRRVPKLNLMIRSDNAAIQRFYEAIGYRRDDVVVMSRRLD